MKNAIELAGVLGLSVPKNWSTIGDKVTVLADNSSGIILEYGEIPILYGFGVVWLTGCRWLQRYHCGEAGRCRCELYSITLLINFSNVKIQLLTYPLEYHQNTSQGEQDLEFYALSTSPNGPGMT